MEALFMLRPVGYRLLVAATVAFFGGGLLASFSLSSAIADDKLKAVATITGEHQKQQFAFGKRVEITKTKVGDEIFAAGRDVILADVSAKTIIAAGMSHSLTGIDAEDLILLGGQLELSGTLKDDIVAAVCPFCPFHGRLHLTKTTQIGDDARLAGRDIAIDGRIGGNLYAFADDFRLAGEVVGNAKIHANRIMLAPGARIGGDLLYVGPDKPEMAEGARVVGKIRQVEADLAFPFGKVDARDWIWYAVWALLGIILAIVLLGAALQLIASGLLSAAANTAMQQPWGSLGRGLAVAILVPGMTVLLMVTVVGVPIGIVTMASFVVLLALAFVAIAYCIGLYVRRLFGWTGPSPGYGSRVLWTTAGIVILAVASLIPFIGWAIGFLAILAGIGGVVQRLRPIFGSREATTA